MPKSEDSGSIELDGDVIRYTSASFPDWTVRVESIRIIGEATNENGPFTDDYFLCFCTGPETWYEAPFYASGCDVFISAFEKKLNTLLRLALFASTKFDSRILWPTEFAGLPMFKFQTVPSETVVGRLLGSLKSEQTFSDHVLAALQK